jgi:hypothetical protein
VKKTLAGKREKTVQEQPASEYRFGYSKAKPNRFAGSMSGGAIAVVLEPDVAAFFGSPKIVNALLRSVIFSAPQSERKRTH